MAHKGAYSNLKFCPKCGMQSIEFDRYREKQNHSKAEYICKICGLGFRIGASARVETANQLFKEQRKVRTGKFGDGVSPEAAEAWVVFTEKQHVRWYQRLLHRGSLKRFFDEIAKSKQQRVAGEKG